MSVCPAIRTLKRISPLLAPIRDSYFGEDENKDGKLSEGEDLNDDGILKRGTLCTMGSNTQGSRLCLFQSCDTCEPRSELRGMSWQN